VGIQEGDIAMICTEGSYDPAKIWREVLEMHRNEVLTAHTIEKIVEANKTSKAINTRNAI